MKRELNEVELMNKEDFYANLDSLALSASAIKLLLDGPKTYYEHYVLGNKEIKKGKHFDEGSLVHCMVLEPDELKNNFVNMGIATPPDSIKGCIDHLLSLERDASELQEYAEEIVAYLKEINLYQSLVDDKKPNKDGLVFTGDEKRINKVINENSIEYFKIMVESRDKTIVDGASWDKCLEKANAILENPKALSLLRTQNDNQEIAFELELKKKVPGFTYKLKGVLDAIKIDHELKKIYVSDVKTTGGLLKDFKASAEKFNYWLQEAIYKVLSETLLDSPSLKEYTVSFNFIVVDRANDVYCFTVTPETSEMWAEELKKLINREVAYHIQEKDFTLPFEFANNLVSL